MKVLNTINEHTVIRETVGYDAIKNIGVCDIPTTIDFLTIVSNYTKICKLMKEVE